MQGANEDDWFYQGYTYLFAKKQKPENASEYRPITCMSNLYKLTTRCVTEALVKDVELRGLLTENQMGTRRRVQGAKEHALTNIIINHSEQYKLYSTWVDVRKAYDSVDHRYLHRVIDSLGLSPWIVRFIKSTMTKWNVELRWQGNKLMHKKIEKGILQGDSLSPLLFVLCMDPLSRLFNTLYRPIYVKTPENHSLWSNHLLYIDDLKLFAEDEGMLADMTKTTAKFLNDIGLEMNREKSATNTEEAEEYAAFLSPRGTYKYLGITEDRNSRMCPKMSEVIKTEIMTRIERLVDGHLSAKNIFKAINEYALSVMNYYIGVVPTEVGYIRKIDIEVRNRLRKHGIVAHNSCVNRLYLPRKELGRGLHNMEHKTEGMMLRLWLTLTANEDECGRRAPICEHFRSTMKIMALITEELEAKYKISFDPKSTVADSIQELQKAQARKLYDVINELTEHKLLYRPRDDPKVDMAGSALWLTKSTLRPQMESRLCNLQDRNIRFGDTMGTHRLCGKPLNVGHLATKCEKLLNGDYTRRHNEICRRIHHIMLKNLGLRRPRKIDRHHVSREEGDQDKGYVYSELEVLTEKAVKHNKPDIVVCDKRRNKITIIEVGITSQDNLHQVEKEKRRKYEELMRQMTHMKFNEKTVIECIPYVLTWDGWVTKYHRLYRAKLGITDKMEAQLQRVCLEMTYATVLGEMRATMQPSVGEQVAEELSARGVWYGLDASVPDMCAYRRLRRELPFW